MENPTEAGSIASTLQVVDLTLGPKDETWKRYNLFQAPVFLKVEGGKILESDQYKAILKGNELTAITSKRYQLFPNEEARRVVQAVTAGGNFQYLKSGKSRGGNAIYDYYTYDGEREIVPNDPIKLGFVMRNSIDGSTGFGLNLFTYRLICENGAIFGQRTLGRLGMRHVLGSDFSIKAVEQAVEAIVSLGDKVIDLYKGWSMINLNQEIAERLVDSRIPVKYLPDYIKVKRKTKEVSLETTPDLWSLFNDITQKVWHKPEGKTTELDPRSQSDYLEELHEVLTVTAR